MKLLDKYNLSSSKLPIIKVEQELARRYVELGDISARNKLLVLYIPFVIKIASKVSNKYDIPIQDLVQVGILSLFSLLEAHNYKKGRLSFYGYQCILKCMKVFVMNSWSVVKVCSRNSVGEKLFFLVDSLPYPDASNYYELLSELAKEIDVSEEQILEMCNKINYRDSNFDTLQESQLDPDYLSTIIDIGTTPETDCINKDFDNYLAKIVWPFLMKLTERERFVIEKRVMLEDTWSLKKLGKHFNVSRERIRQIEKKAMYKLRCKLRYNEKILEELQ